MIDKIEDFEIIEKLHSGESLVYLGIRKKDNKSIIIKSPPSNKLSLAVIERFRHEFELGKTLNHPYFVNYLEYLENSTGVSLIMENPNGISLKDWLISKKGRRASISEFLTISIQLADALSILETGGIIHRDIKPSNILIEPTDLSIKIIDFGLARDVPNTGSIASSGFITGTLEYLSPEQTGRTNRSVDHRSDLYSLGITFYEMLCGNPPFHKKGALDIIYSHIAENPIHPNLKRFDDGFDDPKEEIPEVLSAIILKLISKSPDERYQTPKGLHHDLIICKESLRGVGEIKNFPIAERDSSLRFSIPEKLYGRESEISQLKEYINENKLPHEKQSKSANLILVSGYTGIGKTSLIQKAQESIAEKSGYFISGKFDEIQRATPYSAIIHALDEFAGLILMQSSEKVS
ncbi:MAG: serine/threonine-protein kinase PknK, partial [Leptospira sp.]|nr:serine/threonine-protein kinase PknK [Leptospira sp.]